jgi:O-antigen ligase
MLLGLVASVLIGVFILSAGLGDRLIEETRGYVLRGQERSDFLAASGRVELWREALGNFWQAPFQGFGYFVLAPAGYTEHAGAERPTYGAHNLLLHVLTGTGLIGLTLFVWSVVRLILPHFLFGRLSGEERKMSTLVTVTMLFFFLLGLFEVSFLGAVRPSVVVFIAVLGIGVASRLEPRAP